MHLSQPSIEVLRPYRGIRTLVLGGSGFIGRWVARDLSLAGAEIFLPVRDPLAAKRTFDEFGVLGTIVKTDLQNLEAVSGLIREIDPTIIFNLAGYGVDQTERSEEVAYRINAELVETICSSVGRNGNDRGWDGQRIVHVGSALEYGTIAGDLHEDSQVMPTTIYGKTKLAGTEALTRGCKDLDINGVTARLFTVYGPGEGTSRLLPCLFNAASEEKPLKLTAGLHKRDFTYVEDVAEAMLILGTAKKFSGEVVNVATGVLTRVRDFACMAAEVLGLSEELLEFGSLPTRPEEMQHDAVNIERLKAATGWIPQTSITNGVRRARLFINSKTREPKSLVKGALCELF